MKPVYLKKKSLFLSFVSLTFLIPYDNIIIVIFVYHSQEYMFGRIIQRLDA